MVRLRSVAVCGAAAALAACGGLDNRPLNAGSVEGTLAECDADGVVGVVGEVTLQTPPDGACRFRLDGVAPGRHELFVAPNARKAALVPVNVEARQVVDVGAVEARPGAFARVQVSAPAAVEYAGTVTAPELPLAISVIGRSGMARIGPFPNGCFRLEVTVSGIGQKALSTCLVEGQEQGLDVQF